MSYLDKDGLSQVISELKAKEQSLRSAATSATESTLNSRIDTIIANPAPTDGNSELVDIRVTSSGRTLATAGAATRFQSYLYNKTIVPVVVEEGFYLSEAGIKVVAPSSIYSYSEVVLEKGEYYLECVINGVQRALKFQGDTYPALSGSIAVTNVGVMITVHQQTTVIVSSYNSIYPKIYKTNEVSTDASMLKFNDYTPIAGQYVTRVGGLALLASFSYFDIPVRAGEAYYIKGSVAGSARLYYVDGAAFPLTDTSPEAIVENTVVVQNDGVMRVSYRTSVGIDIQSSFLNDNNCSQISAVNEKIDGLSGANYEFYRSINRNVLALGDSLTSGANYQSPLTGQSIEECYPYYLNLSSGWIVTNAGFSGITPLGMWEDQISIGNFVGTNYDSCIMWLGTNGDLTDTVVADTSSGNYLTYADTNTGRYCSIIEKLLDDNQFLKIYLIKIIGLGGGTVPAKNLVVEQIGAKYNLPVLDINENGEVFPAPYIHTANALHFDKIGNVVVADGMYKKITSHIYNNLSDYNQVLLGQRTTTIFDN